MTEAQISLRGDVRNNKSCNLSARKTQLKRHFVGCINKNNNYYFTTFAAEQHDLGENIEELCIMTVHIYSGHIKAASAIMIFD